MTKNRKNEKLPYKPAKLYEAKRQWYIEFQAFSEDNNSLIKKRILVPTAGTQEERRKWANDQVMAINEMLSNGFHFKAEKPKEEKPSEPKAIEAIGRIVAMVEQSMRKDTSRTYRNIANAFCQYLTESKQASIKCKQLTGAILSLYLDKMASAGKSNTTLNNHLTVLKAIGAKMQERGWNNGLASAAIKRRRQEESQNKPFTDDEREQLTAYFKQHDPGMHIATMLLYHAFIRPAEIVQLKVSDFDMTRGIIMLAGSKTKNGKNANVPISRLLLEALEEAGIQSLNPSDYIVGKGIMPGRVPVARTRLTEAHSKAMAALGIGEGRTLYSWKDTGACNAYRAGMDLKTLQSLLRHHSVAITEIYLRGLGQAVYESVKGFDW